MHTYGRPQVVFTHGKGCYLYDTDGAHALHGAAWRSADPAHAGTAYLDFAAGIAVNCLGHSDPAWQEALAAQAGKLCHTSNLYLTEPGGRLARTLVENSFADRVFFANSGTEANEAALKFARKFQVRCWRGRAARCATVPCSPPALSPQRVKWEKEQAAKRVRMPWSRPATEFIAFSDCFHGRTMGALSLTWKEGYRKPFEPLIPGSHFAPFGDLAAVKKLARRGRTAAILVEPVQGEGGIRPADPAFLAGLRQLCDDIGALLIFDEVQCGLGRTGRLWGHEASGVTPDMMSLAKPLAAGLPIGALLCTQRVADAMQPGDHGSTFAGGPLVCAAAQHVVDRVRAPAFLQAIAARGEQLLLGLRVATAGISCVKEVRGCGLLVGIQLDRPAAPLVEACRTRGLLVITAGKGDIVRLVPPLVVSAAEVDTAVKLLAEELAKMSALPPPAAVAH